MRETAHPRNSEENTTARILRATFPYRCHMLSKWKENSSPPQNNAATGARRGSQQRSETNRHARTQHHTPATTCSSPHPLCSYSTGLAARPVVTCIIYKGFVYHNYLDGVIEMEIKSLGPLRGRGEQRSQAGGSENRRYLYAWERCPCAGGCAVCADARWWGCAATAREQPQDSGAGQTAAQAGAVRSDKIRRPGG